MWQQTLLCHSSEDNALPPENTQVHLSQKLFWFLFAAFCVSSAVGVGSRLLFSKADMLFPTLPCVLAISFVHLFCLMSQNLETLKDLWLAFLIWIYVPFCVAAGFMDCAMGIDEGIPNISHFQLDFSPMCVVGLSALLMTIAAWLTNSYLVAKAMDRTTQVRPYLFTSAKIQVVFGTLIFLAAWNS